MTHRPRYGETYIPSEGDSYTYSDSYYADNYVNIDNKYYKANDNFYKNLEGNQDNQDNQNNQNNQNNDESESENDDEKKKINIELKKFDLNYIKSNNLCLIIGNRETGKSTLVKDLLYHKRNIPIGTLISNTEKYEKIYNNIIPSLCIHEEYKSNIVNIAIKRQNLTNKKKNKDKEKYGKSNIDPSAFLIIDNCFYNNQWIKNKEMKELFINNRYLEMLTIITLQSYDKIDRYLFDNIDYIFILKDSTFNIKKLYDQLCEHQDFNELFEFEIFSQIIEHCTNNYDCLVIDIKSNNLSNKLLWYKATTHDTFKVCSPEFWREY